MTTRVPYAMPPTSRAATPAVDAVRGFVFVSGRSWFRDHGLLDAYMAHLPERLRERAGLLTAGEWIPLADAMACYAACDALALPEAQQVEIGRAVSAANNGRVVETIARLAGGLGVSPWIALQSLHKVWLRSNRGGAVAVYELGTHEARVELWQVPMVRSPFFCSSMRGAIQAGLALLRPRARVELSDDAPGVDSLALRAAW